MHSHREQTQAPPQLRCLIYDLRANALPTFPSVQATATFLPFRLLRCFCLSLRCHLWLSKQNLFLHSQHLHQIHHRILEIQRT